ncbi:MAG: peptidylprolyl isomerase, partial [Myxococcota bacterium]
ASHILLKIPAGSGAEVVATAEARAKELRAKLLGGADFSELALTNSDDTGAPGGDLGCFGRGEMVQAFEAAAFTQEIGSISEPVRTQFGLHLIRVNSREVQEEGCSSQQELAPIQGEIYQEELERQMNAWVEELRDKSFVEVRL